MKKHFIYFNWQLDIPFFGIILDHIDELLKDNNNEIFFISCDAKLKNCVSNKMSSPIICSECNVINSIGLNKYKTKIKQYKIGDFLQKNNDYSNIIFKYNNINLL